MEKLKKILNWFANPKWWFLLPVMLIAIGSTIGGTLIMTQGMSEYRVWGYAILGVMIVTLSYSIFGVIRIYPKAKERILKWSEKHLRIHAAFTQYGFTTLIATTGSLVVTLAFAVYNGSIAVVIHSIWFGALAAYYVVLIILRVCVLVYHGRRKQAVQNGQSETKTLIRDGKLYRACGILLLQLPICLSFVIMQMVRAGDSFEHKGITIYVYAIYAFYKIITAIYSFIKERHNHAMTISAIKSIKLADAFVSILALQTAMFREFASAAEKFDSTVMNAVTGLIVCVLTVAIGVYMIIVASLRIKKLKQVEKSTSDEQSENDATQNDREQ